MKRSIFEDRGYYKPFDYPEFFEAWSKQQSMFWLHTEVSIFEDKNQYYSVLTEDERYVISSTLKFFAQTDMQVSRAYMGLLSYFKMYEVQMCLASFINMETIHAEAYSYLMDRLKLGDDMFESFNEYRVMKEKNESMMNLSVKNYRETLKTLAYVGGFVEGFILYSSFCVLMSLSREGLLKGLAQISTFAMRDETLHSVTTCHLFKTYLNQIVDKGLITKKEYEEVIEEITEIFDKELELEMQFIDIVFDNGSKKMRNLQKENVVSYVRYLACNRVQELGIKIKDKHKYNPEYYPSWMDGMTNLNEFVDFFTIRPTQYQKVDIGNIGDDAFE